MQKVYGKICIVVILFCLTGCSTKFTYAPSLLHFSTPEAAGALGSGSVNFSVASAPEYTLGTFNYSGTTVSNTPQSVSPDAIYTKVDVRLGLLNNIDFYFDSNRVFGAKIQWLGASRLAKEAGLKFATEIRLGKGTSSDSFSGSDGASSVDIVDVSLNVGYRLNRTILSYFNIYKSNNTISASASSETIVGGTVTSSSSYTFEAKSQSQGVLLGVQLTPQGKPASVIFEAGVAQTTWDNFETLTAYPFGISLGYVW